MPFTLHLLLSDDLRRQLDPPGAAENCLTTVQTTGLAPIAGGLADVSDVRSEGVKNLEKQ